MRTLLLTFILSTTLKAQSGVVNINGTYCTGTDPTKPRALVVVPIAGIQVPLCLVVGAGLKVNMNALGGPALEAVVTAAVPGPTGPTGPQGPQGLTGPAGPQGLTGPAGSGAVVFPQMESFALDPATVPLTQARLSFTLAKTPAPNTFLVMIFRSSSWPGDSVQIVSNPQAQLDIGLPLMRSQAAGDMLYFRYYSTVP